ncbi:lipopolysaccharide assembly protein LapA domain-containing protein [Primorskyibacter sp. S187A]|uniref:lipopolysaccharide assembly protein LapA domain-containing protein n=1 Tax=Primorskyibacter sp. S187A TaxID=3415130 RepID=UPI003C7987B6
MRYIKYAFLASVAIVLVTLALANRNTVTLNSLPDGLAGVPGLGPFAVAVELPLFLVILGGVVAGLLIGFVWEWIREAKHRTEAARKTAEVKSMERELRRLKRKNSEGQDEVLAILDEAS